MIMDTMRLEHICERAISYLGKETQIKKCVEELAELRDELNNSYEHRDMDKIHDEIADVLIMMVQMQMIFDFDLIYERVKIKSARLNDMINVSQEIESRLTVNNDPKTFRKLLWRKGVGPKNLSLVRYFSDSSPEIRHPKSMEKIVGACLGIPSLDKPDEIDSN